MTDLSVIDPLVARRTHLLESVFSRDGLDWCQEHADIADEVIRTLFREIVGTSELPIALVATGGYGRQELAPYSDIDLTLVCLDESDPHLDAIVRELYRALDDAFKKFDLILSYAYRLIGDVPGLDGETRTGLVDARFLVGSHRTFATLMDALWFEFPIGDFLLSKLAERDRAMAKTHSSPLVVEPHLKDGAGGLRCFQCANWIRISTNQQATRPTRAYETVLRYRNWLHALLGKKQDEFVRARQAELVDRLGGDLDSVMGPLTQAMIVLDEGFQLAREEIAGVRFALGPGVESIRGEARVLGNADPGQAAQGIAMATQLGLRVSNVPAGLGPLQQGAEAYYALTRGERVLRNLDRAGLLEAILPELTRCRTLMPKDSTHRYTVFEHSLRVFRNLETIPPGTVYAEIRDQVREPDRLYFVALLHDLGKALPGRPHAESGEELAREIGERMQLESTIIEDSAWLVRHHLDMARFIRMRDVDHPDTARDFAEIVGNADRLNLLTLLTWADISAVAPNILTPVQEAFLKQLYADTRELLEAHSTPDLSPAVTRRRLQRELGTDQIPPEDQQRFLEALPAHYLISAEPDLVALHYRYAQRALTGNPIIEISPLRDLSASDVTVCALDEPGLLSRFLGVFYALGLGVHKMRVCTVQTPPPVALDTFTLSHGNRPIPDATAANLDATLRAVIAHEITTEEVMRKHGLDPDRRQNVFSFQFLEGKNGILEVQAPRGRGMAYRVARMISAQGWNIRAARVSQWAGRGSAAFYLSGADDQPLSREQVESVIGSQV